MKTKKKLTPQQERFCREYLIDLNATAAAKRAKYSAKSASEIAYQLLQKTSVQEFLAHLKEEQNKRLEIKSDRILKELMRVGFSDVGDIFDEEGRLLPVRQMPLHVRRAISGIEVCTEWETVDGDKKPIGTTTKIKFWKKEKALELLGKNQKLWTDVHEHKGKVTLEQLVLGSMEDDEEDDNGEPQKT